MPSKKKFAANSSTAFTTDDVLAFADINTVGMDTNSLSSNWKKLQATLKKAPSASTSSPGKKRKASDRDSGHGTVKKQKPGKEYTKTRDTITPYKRKRMSEGAEIAVNTADADSIKPSLRRKSSAGVSVQSETESRNGKVNEGRSKT